MGGYLSLEKYINLGTYLVYYRDFLFLSMWSSVSGSVMDQKKNTRNSPWSDSLHCSQYCLSLSLNQSQINPFQTLTIHYLRCTLISSSHLRPGYPSGPPPAPPNLCTQHTYIPTPRDHPCSIPPVSDSLRSSLCSCLQPAASPQYRL